MPELNYSLPRFSPRIGVDAIDLLGIPKYGGMVRTATIQRTILLSSGRQLRLTNVRDLARARGGQETVNLRTCYIASNSSGGFSCTL